MSERWIIVSCIRGEPSEPRVIDGERRWSTASKAEAALVRYCDLNGLDPDDFTTQRERGGRNE